MVGDQEFRKGKPVNDIPKITAAMTGTWLSGGMGWHNSYRVVDAAEGYGFVVPDEYREALADYRENGHGASEDNWEAVCGHGELADMATDHLNSVTQEGYVFVWDMGEFSLVSEADAEFI